MSEVIGTATIYGTFADATAYIAARYGSRYSAWSTLDAAAQKQTLVNAADYLNRKSWTEAADTFAERDAILDGDGRPVFQLASYEMAVLIVEDETITDNADQGTNIQAVNAGGAGVTYFNPQSSRQGSAPILPTILMDLIGAYLSSASSDGPDGGSGQGGSGCNPFDGRNDFNRWNPF